jgi:copper(I)-binding protein
MMSKLLRRVIEHELNFRANFGLDLHRELAAMRSLLALLILFCLTGPLAAEEARIGGLHVHQPWARASAGPAKAGAVYLTIMNHGEKPDRLIAAASPAGKKLALHHNIQEGDVMKMRPLEGGLALPVGQYVSLEPGGVHIMIMGLESPLEEGASHPLTLTFEQAGSLETSFVVHAVGAMTGPEGHHKHDHKHGD